MKSVFNVVMATILATSLVTGAYAKATPPKKGFEATKKAKIKRLEAKLEAIQKRLACIKKAKKSSEIKECEKKYPLIKRSKKLKKKAKKSK